MTSRPGARAPETAHLRSRLRRGIAKKAPRLPSRKRESNAEFRDSFDHYWVTFLPTGDSPKIANATAVVHSADKTVCAANDLTDDGQDSAKLCHILRQISHKFAADGRPYVSMAAAVAISLVRKGRVDEINPGLWKYIREREKSVTRRQNN